MSTGSSVDLPVAHPNSAVSVETTSLGQQFVDLLHQDPYFLKFWTQPHQVEGLSEAEFKFIHHKLVSLN